MKVYLSSTCYDLPDLRAEIENYFRNKGYDLLLSDRTNFPVNTDQHRHDVCIENVELCDLFVLVIDARYGAPYHKNEEISITWAEFRRAAKKNKNIIAFVRNEIFTERHIYNHNKKLNNPFNPIFAKNTKIFEFIDEVQVHSSGVWIQMFSNSIDIKQRLDNLYETRHSLINESTGPKGLETDSLSLTDVSGSTGTYISNYISVNVHSSSEEDLINKAIESIPEKPQIKGELIDSSLIPSSSDYFYFFPIEDEENYLIGMSASALGKAVRKELEELSKKLKKKRKR